MSTQFRLPNNWLPQSIDRHEATVVGLLFGRSPSAVAGGVRAIVVNSIKLMKRGWFASHVSKKVDIIVPARVDRDAAPSPVFETRSVGIVTAGAHCLPRAVFWRSSIFSMLSFGFSVVFFGAFLVEASAGFGDPSSQVAAENKAFVSAVATTQKASVSARRVDIGKNDQAIKALTREIMHVVNLTGRKTDVNPV